MSGQFTTEWLNRHEARRAQTSKPRPSPEAAIDEEGELHCAIQDECRRRGWLPFHGSMAHSTFRTEGEPDFVILCDGGRLLLVECKSKTGKPSTAQLGIAAWANRLGHKVHEVRCFNEFLALLE